MKRLAMKKNKIKDGIISQSIFRTFFLSLAIILNIHAAYAQGIVPNGKSTFLDNNGKPLASGQVFFYAPGTTNPQTTYQDIGLTIPNTNPIILDAAGRALIWGNGNFRQIVKDKLNNQIWDVTTSANGSGGGGGPTATGDGDLVGTIKPWAGPQAPNQYAFTYGQSLSRITFATLFTAITSQQSVFCNSGSATLTGLGDTNSFWVGMTVEIACVSGGQTTIIAKTINTVIMNTTANSTINTNATFFLYGNGDGATTFNLPDLRGVVPMGNNIMGGIASTNINTTNFGTATPNGAGSKGGAFSTSGSYTLKQTDLPNIPLTFAGTSTGTLTANQTAWQGAAIAGGFQSASGSSFAFTSSPSLSAITIPAVTPAGNIVVNGSGNSLNSGVTQTAFSLIPPTRTLNYIIKTTPDANSASASGVTALGGMTGSVACGTNVVCTGNIISVNIPSNFSSLSVNPGPVTITSSSTAALTVGQNGATNPALQVNASVGSSATGVGITSFATGGGVAISTLSSATNENLAVTSKGNQSLTLNNANTGSVIVGNSTGGVALNGTVINNGTIAGGTATNASLTVESTTNGSPSGDIVNILGSTVNLRNSVNSTGTIISLGGAGGGVTLNIGSAADGTAAINIFSNTGSKQVLAPSSGTIAGTLTFPAGTTTLPGLAIVETFTAQQTFTGAMLATSPPATSATNQYVFTVATGTFTLGTSAIASGACASVVTVSASGVATTDIVEIGFNGDPTATTGYSPPNMLAIIPYPTSNNVNVKVCNNTAASITPGATTLNFKVRR